VCVCAAWGPIPDIRFRSTLNVIGLLHTVIVRHLQLHHNSNIRLKSNSDPFQVNALNFCIIHWIRFSLALLVFICTPTPQKCNRVFG
jgi:hypothetical protein